MNKKCFFWRFIVRAASLPGAIAGRRMAAFLCLFALGMGADAAALQSDQSVVDLTEVPLEKLMEIEIPTVYGASKFEQKETEAPSLVTVISADEIKRYGYRTLADVLRSVPGLYVSYDRNYAFLGAGGVNLGDFNSRILVLVDGHRLNSGLTDGAYIDTAFILDIDLVDHIEIIRGPGSVLYGNNAFFGVINIVTRQGKQLNGAEASGEYGGYDAWKGRVTYGRTFANGLQFLLSGTLFDREGAERLYYGQFNTPSQNFGIAEDIDSDSARKAFGSISYRDFSLESAYLWREKQNPTAQFFTTFNDPRLETTDKRGYVNLNYSHSFPEIVDVKAQLYYDRADFRIGYPTSEPGGTTLFEETDTGEWWGADIQFNRKIASRHVLTAGFEYRDDFRQERRIFDADTGQVFTDVHRSRISYGIYGQGDFAVLTNLHLNAGLRLDKSGDFDLAYSPRVAVIYSPWEKSTFKAIYGSAFRAPNFLELSDPRFQDISPETIDSYQLVYEQQIGRHLRPSVAGFFNHMDNLIALQNGIYENFDVESKGLELALEANLPYGIRGRGSYTLEKAESLSSGTSLPDSPQHLFKLNLSVPIVQEKIFASLEYQYTSSRHSVFTTSSGDTVPGSDAGGFGIVNVTIFSQNIVKNLELSAGIYNLFDRKYSDPASRFHLQDLIEQDGRSFRVKVTYRF
jgi:outer membrane receptor for ferrienterochelin and colicins